MTNTEKLNCLTDRPCTVCKYHKENGCSKWSCVFEQEPTTKTETLVSLDVYKQVAKERDIAIQQLHELGYDFGQKIEPTTKNDLEVDCISRADAIRVASGYCHPSNVAKELAKLPSVTPQEPKTGHWKSYLKEGLRYQCSACDSRFDTPWEYCPHCGAKMAETEAEDGHDD